MKHDEIAGARLNLILEAIDLCFQRVSAARALDPGLGTDDGVEENDGAEAAADAVQEGQRENFDCAATGCHAWLTRADRNQCQLDAGLTQSHVIAGINANALLHTLAVDERAECAVVE